MHSQTHVSWEPPSWSSCRSAPQHSEAAAGSKGAFEHEEESPNGDSPVENPQLRCKRNARERSGEESGGLETLSSSPPQVEGGWQGDTFTANLPPLRFLLLFPGLKKGREGGRRRGMWQRGELCLSSPPLYPSLSAPFPSSFFSPGNGKRRWMEAGRLLAEWGRVWHAASGVLGQP